MTEEPVPKEKYTLGRGVLYVAIGHTVVLIIMLIYWIFNLSKAVNLADIQYSFVGYLAALFLGQYLYTIPLAIIFAFKKRWAVLGGVLLAMGLTMILSFSLCVGTLMLGNNFH